jgi:hypothetical protein
MSILTLLLLAVFVIVWSFVIRGAIRKSKAIRDGKASPSIQQPIYGAWQGHNLGTTIMEPGELTELEKELRSTSKN